MVAYVPRIIDRELDALLAELPALALEGPRGVGKTTTALRRASAVFRLDDPGQRELVAADPSQLDAGEGTVLVDEWQRHPPVWDHVRRRVDEGAPPARYLLTGSASPHEAPAHSGAGRIVPMRMRPLSLAERGLAEPTVSMARLLSGARPAIGGATTMGLRDYVEEILASGLPGIRHLSGRARRAQLDGYLAQVVERDFTDQGLRVRRPATLRGWLAAYAAATATTTGYTTLLGAAHPGETPWPAKTTTIAYRDVLSRLWLLDPVPGWLPGRGHLHRLTVAPKHHLADPALSARLLGVDERALLSGMPADPAVPRDGTLLGALFESLVTMGVKVYAQANEATVHHLRTKEGRHEVDLIVERADHRVIALEVKLGSVSDAHDTRHLAWLAAELGDDLLDSMVVTTGDRAYRRQDGIGVVPAVLLGA
jgi:hypothetical protein